MKQILKKIDFLKVGQLIMVVALSFLPLVAPQIAGAQINRGLPCDSSTGLNCSTNSFNGFIRIIINWLLGIAFAIAVLFLIIGGFQYITSAGNEEAAEKGRGTATNAVIGIIIIILSYVIVNVISNLVSNPNSTSAP